MKKYNKRFMKIIGDGKYKNTFTPKLIKNDDFDISVFNLDKINTDLKSGRGTTIMQRGGADVSNTKESNLSNNLTHNTVNSLQFSDEQKLFWICTIILVFVLWSSYSTKHRELEKKRETEFK